MEHTSILVARSLWQALASCGLRQVVLSPGSRNAPLGYSAAGAEQGEENAPQLSLTVRIDERSAAFTALGMALATGEPVAVVTTSGTAAANLYPAVLEAHHSGVPLVVITADRPHNLRGTGANQTTNQVGMFGDAVRLSVDLPAFSTLFSAADQGDLQAVAARLSAAALGKLDGRPGPVHLNIAFADPLFPVTQEWPAQASLHTWVAPRTPAPPADSAQLPAELLALLTPEVPGVVVAGNGAGQGARELAEHLGWPLLAEPSSGARSGPNAITAYSRVLADSQLSGLVRAAVVLGQPTLTRPVQRLLADPQVSVALVHPSGLPWVDAPRRARFVLPALPDLSGPAAGVTPWLQQWQEEGAQELERQLGGVNDAGEAEFSALAVTSLVAEASGADDLLVVGSSNPIRHLDTVASWPAAGPRVLANRGLAGIDGTLGTAIGAALVQPTLAQPAARVRVLLGDLTFLHDAGSLLIGTAERRPNLQVVVINNGGGAIFSDLEHGAVARSSDAFAAQVARVMTTAQCVDLGELARGYGAGHVVVETAAQLQVALDDYGSGVQVIEARVSTER